MSSVLIKDMSKMPNISENIKHNIKKKSEEFNEFMARDNRSELVSKNGDTAEIYDQFYRDHKLLLKLFVFLGVMPLAREAGKVTFNWKSPQMMYAVFFYVFASTLVLRVGYERIKILQTITEFDEYIYAIIFLIFLVPHFWIPYVGWGVANRVAHYKTMWGSFQVQFYRVTGTTLTFPSLNTLIIILFMGCVLLSVVFLYSLSRLMDGFLLWHTMAYFHIITMINMNAALFYINSKATITASNNLSKCFEKDMKTDGNSSVISQYRILWLNLSDILQTLGNTYARTYSTYCLFMSINIAIGSYGALSEIFDSGFSYKVLGLIVLTIYCASLLFIVCNCAHKATSFITESVQQSLLSANLLKMDLQSRREIDLFISAIELNPPVVNMEGYGTINRQLVTSTISTITIYLIVLLQFKLSIVTDKIMKAKFEK